MTIEFKPWPKIPRLNKEVTYITEKIDGTNACVIIDEDGNIGAASRTRLLTPGKNTDNFGFSAWVQDNKEELLKLGPGHHHGEWYGKGIQREYGLNERRFALFNTYRWGDASLRPSCCEVAPLLGTVSWEERTSDLLEYADYWLSELEQKGSVAVSGFMKPEGIIMYHTASNSMHKYTVEHRDGKFAS